MKKHVLLIDEDQNELVSFMEILKNIKEAFRCRHAESGKQVIEILRHTVPDFIFIDLQLSEMSALQVLSAIRFQSKFKETHVYIYSDYISEDISKMARMLGATGCIEKSGEFSELVHKFKAIFSPELLPSYVFLKNSKITEFFCYNVAFLNTVVDDAETIRDLSLQAKNLTAPEDNDKFHIEMKGESVEPKPGKNPFKRPLRTPPLDSIAEFWDKMNLVK